MEQNRRETTPKKVNGPENFYNISKNIYVYSSLTSERSNKVIFNRANSVPIWKIHESLCQRSKRVLIVARIILPMTNDFQPTKICRRNRNFLCPNDE